MYHLTRGSSELNKQKNSMPTQSESLLSTQHKVPMSIDEGHVSDIHDSSTQPEGPISTQHGGLMPTHEGPMPSQHKGSLHSQYKSMLSQDLTKVKVLYS